MSKMPKGGTIINTARKEVINEDDLKMIFEGRPDFKYISDIAPDCHNDLLKYEARYYSTPKKQGAETSEANINAGLAAANQIVNFLKNGDRTFLRNSIYTIRLGFQWLRIFNCNHADQIDIGCPFCPRWWDTGSLLQPGRLELECRCRRNRL